MMNDKINMAHFLVEANNRSEGMKKALLNIFINTISLEPSSYKGGVLSNIKKAVGDETYEFWLGKHK